MSLQIVGCIVSGQFQGNFFMKRPFSPNLFLHRISVHIGRAVLSNFVSRLKSQKLGEKKHGSRRGKI